MPTGVLAPSKKDEVVMVKKVSDKVASVFGDDSESDVRIQIIILFKQKIKYFIFYLKEEEMPLEAKMKMRNIGRLDEYL